MGEAAALEVWPYKLLQREQHERLVEDMKRVASAAGIPVAALDRSMAESGCSKEEISWVVHYNAHLASDEPGGLILEGKNWSPAPVLHMHAIAAAFVRNYMDARVVSLSSLKNEDADIDPRILLVPDFYQDSTTGGAALANFEFQRLHGLLLERFSARRGTVLHVDSMAGVKGTYGKSFADFLLNNWKVIASS